MRSFIIILSLVLTTGSIATAQVNSGQYGKRGGKGGPMPKTVKGRIIDANSGQGLEYATISITNKRDGSIAGGGLSEAGGNFEFKVKGRRLAATIEFISYETIVIDSLPITKGNPIIDLGDIILSPSSVQIDDVEIIAERSETSFSLDKKIFTVGKDLANRGGTAEDVLNNVPSLDVDIEGTVTLRGSEGVRILIDGKPSSMVGVDDGSGLRNLASNLIERIEVITNPSARYDAEGMAGIINIVLKKDKGHGFNGSVDVSGGYPTNAGVSANINYRKDNLNWFANYGINYRTGPGGGYSIQDQQTQDYRQLTILDRNINRKGISNNIRFGADYFINDKTQITGAFQYKTGNDNNNSDLLYKDYVDSDNSLDPEPLWLENREGVFLDFDTFDEGLDQSLLFQRSFRTDVEAEDESALQYSVNFSKEYSSRDHKLNASLSYQDRAETESNVFEESISNIDGATTIIDQTADNDEISKTWELQLDYVKPLGIDHKWEAGLKGSLRTINTNYLVQQADATGNFMPLPGLDNSFDYDEDIIAAYGLYGNRINNFSYQVGLRSEYSFINTKLAANENIPENKRDYLNLFPSAHVSLHLNDTDALQISYSRRINRPRFWDLNPFFTFQDSRNYFSGNPNIDPEYTDAFEIGQIKYWEGLSLSSSLFYRRTQDTKQRFLTVDNTTSFTLRIPVNIGTRDDYGLDLSLGYTAIKWLRVTFNTNIFRNQLSFDQDDVIGKVFEFYTTVQNVDQTFEEFTERYSYNLNETDNLTWNAKMTTKFTFLDSDLQLRFNYRGPRQQAQGDSRAIGSLDVGWSKDFLKAKNLTLTLSIRDVFNSRRRAGQLYLDEFFQQSEFQWRARTGTLTASYRINQKKKRGGGGRSGNYEGSGEF